MAIDPDELAARMDGIEPAKGSIGLGVRRAFDRLEEAMLEGSCLCGAARWRFDRLPESATACNCTACRRYGALWAYDYEGAGIEVSGATKGYVRGTALAFHFCSECGAMAYWRALGTDKEGRRRIAVNLRLADPDAVAGVPVDHFDGLVGWEDLPRDGRCVKDLWF
ncbi:MAG TPA: GFA family protein [Caldimonas sp.]|nr:GFA family protein [Caldimonas sp.]